MDCKKELYFLCGTYLFPPKTGSRMPTATRPTRDQSDWMKKYSSKKLRDIVMPGSHHSGFHLILYEFLRVSTFFDFITSIQLHAYSGNAKDFRDYTATI